jgi:hypothetical protein
MANSTTATPPPPERIARATLDVERRLADAELFFSTTDRKGVITAGNRVFERVSRYALDELTLAAS